MKRNAITDSQAILLGARVLVADDEPSIRQLIGLMLRREPGIDVVEAVDGLAAIAALDTDHFDLCLLDLRMPGADGFAVLRRLREMESAPPAIVITGNPELENVVEAMRLGAFDFIAKPIERDKLAVTVRNALRLSRGCRSVLS